MVEAILYLLRAGCSWRLLPHDFPTWQTVCHYQRRWQREGVWAKVHHTLVMADRERAGREASRPAAITDSQTVRTTDQKGGFKGYGEGRPWPRWGRVSAPNGKKDHGRKRNTLTDTDGRLLAVEVHAADIQDRNVAKGVLKRSRRSFPFVETVFADGAYAGRLVAWARDTANVTLEIIRRMPWMKGFVVIRRRWVVERTFAWIMKCRRLARDYEQLPSVVETLITIAASATLLRRWP
jgi:putative transposase